MFVQVQTRIKYLNFKNFQDILKYSERIGCDTTDLKKAVEVMHVVPKAANDMMNVGRLQGFDVCPIVALNINLVT